MLLKLQD